MARKSMGKAAKVLGGLGAMYALTGAIAPKVRLGDPAADGRIAETMAEFSRRPLHEPSDAEQAERARENARRLAKLPLVTDAEQAQYFSGIKNLARTENDVPIRTSDGYLMTGSELSRKKGGTVKGWGKARGARKAKVY